MVSFPTDSRGERIRTSDLTVPIRVRYRTALRPDVELGDKDSNLD